MSCLQPRPILPAQSAASSHSVLKQKACVPCKTRKVKCDRRSPCSNCVSWKAQCVYPSPIRRCHRPPKSAKPTADQARPEREIDGQRPLDERLAVLEATLSRLSLLVGSSIQSVPNSVDSAGSQVGNECDSAKIDLLNRLEDGANEIASQLLPCKRSDKISGPEIYATPLTSPMGRCQLDNRLSSLLPTRAQTTILWRQFREIADQQVKIVHQPQAELTLFRAYTSYASQGPAEIALIFAILFAALVGMPNYVIEDTLGMCKTTALSTYQQAAEQAVMKAISTSNQSLMTLQAMTILVAFSVYLKDDKKAWPLTGMARRLNPASSTNAGTAFEMEMRRRIWWQLWYLDHRATINNGEEIELGYTSQVPELPANVLDDDLDPDMKSIPPSRNNWTPVSFSLMNWSIGRTAVQIDRTPSWTHRRALIDDCARRVQTAYLRHCTGYEPIHWLARHVAYVHFTELRMKLHSQRNQQATTQAQSMDRNRLVVDVTDILDVPNRLQNEPQAHKWKWTLNSFPHFTHLSFLLDEISQLQILPPPFQLWTIAEQAFSRAEAAMPASVKNKQVLRLSKKKAEDCLQLLLEWQRAADEVENFMQLPACSIDGLGEVDAFSNPTLNVGEFPGDTSAPYSSLDNFEPGSIGFNSSLLDLSEFTSNFSTDANGSNSSLET